MLLGPTALDLSGDWSPVRDSTIHIFHAITTLNLTDNPHITDAGLSSLTALTALNLTRNKCITSDGLSRLESLTALNLTANDTVVDVRILAPRLRALSLAMASVHDTTRITDEQVSCMTRLQELNLDSNDVITDRGLVGLTRLQRLSLLDQDSVTGTYQPLVAQGGLLAIAVVELDVGLRLDKAGRIVEVSNVDLLFDGIGDILRGGGGGVRDESAMCVTTAS